jgi:hypothetical protein
LASTRGNSVNRNLLFEIVGFVYEPVVIQTNTVLILPAGQLFGLRRPRIYRKDCNLTQHASPVYLGSYRLIVGDDFRLYQNFIVCHAGADQRRRNRTKSRARRVAM